MLSWDWKLCKDKRLKLSRYRQSTSILRIHTFDIFIALFAIMMMIFNEKSLQKILRTTFQASFRVIFTHFILDSSLCCMNETCSFLEVHVNLVFHRFIFYLCGEKSQWEWIKNEKLSITIDDSWGLKRDLSKLNDDIISVAY